jgi:GTP-binding protein
MAMLDETAVTYQVVLTKIDKIKQGELFRRQEKTMKAIAKRPAAYPELICTSSVKKNGLDILKGEIAALALPDHSL